MADLIEKLDDLIVQATKERSHYYVKSVVEKAKWEIVLLRAERDQLRKMVTAITLAEAGIRSVSAPPSPEGD